MCIKVNSMLVREKKRNLISNDISLIKKTNNLTRIK